MVEFELIVPCYNEADSLPQLISAAVGAACAHGFTSETFQLVLVDNGSKDATPKVWEQERIRSLSKWFRQITLPENRGYGGGIWAGLSLSKALYLGWTHADLQTDIGDAFRALEELKNGSCSKRVIKGRRTGRGLSEFVVSRSYETTVGWYLRFWCYEINAQPKVFPRELLEVLSSPPSGISFDAYVLWQARRAGYEIDSIPVKLLPRQHGESHWAKGLSKKLQTFSQVLKQLQTLRH